LPVVGQLLLLLVENVIEGGSYLEIELLKLSDSDAGTGSRILFNILDFDLFFVHPIVYLDIVVDREYFSETLLVQHLVNSLSDHVLQFLLVGVPHPKDKTIFVAKFSDFLAVIFTDRFLCDDYAFEELEDALLVVAMGLQSDCFIFLKEKFVSLFF
jgi:hypothetical protein